jgi:hypothetical protein
MDLMDAYLKLKAEESELKERRAQKEAELNEVVQALSRNASNLSALLDVAVHFGVIREDEVEMPAAEEIRPNAWLGYKRQAAVESALIELNRPVHLRDIVEFLRSKGRTDDTVDLVSAALSALRHKGLAEPRGSGVWVRAGTDDTPTGLRQILGQEAEVR